MMLAMVGVGGVEWPNKDKDKDVAAGKIVTNTIDQEIERINDFVDKDLSWPTVTSNILYKQFSSYMIFYLEI